MYMQVSTIGYIVLDSCTNVQLKGPTTLTYTQAQFPFAQANILAVTDALHYTIQVWPPAATTRLAKGVGSCVRLSIKGDLPVVEMQMACELFQIESSAMTGPISSLAFSIQVSRQ
jgi:hypothetical protein